MNTIHPDVTPKIIRTGTPRPASDACSPAESDTITGDSPLSDAELLNSRIVVVDDEPATTGLIKSILGKAGFGCVRTFNHAVEAFEYLQNNRSDLVLLDIRMPEMDGISILKFLRSQTTTQFVPMIVLTSERGDTTRLDALNAGANDFVHKPVNADELIARVKNSLTFRLHTDKIEREVATVTQELHVDALTGLNNRRAFDKIYCQTFPATRNDQVSLILLDVDNFKQTNDRRGHVAGDAVLRHIGSIMKSCCRPDEFVARMGGDEFAILCPNSDLNRPLQLGDQIRKRIANEPTPYQNEYIASTISVGIAATSDKINDKGQLYVSADAALYRSKHQGRNTLNQFSEAESSTRETDHLKTAPKLPDLKDSAAETRSAKILVVDDESTVTQMVQLQLNRVGYANVNVENDALQAMGRIKAIDPDLVILDVRMPGINGLEILRLIRGSTDFSSIPVLIMTGTDDDQIRMAALKLQANDFLTKPAKPAELDVRVHNALLTKFQHDRLNDYAKRLNHEIEIRTDELFSTRRETILCLARAGESRDKETGNHVIRVGCYAAVIARKMGLDPDYVGWIELAAQLHDVGKLSIPDAILHKPGKLDPEERSIIETHCDNADKIFFGQASVPAQTVITSPLLKMAARISSSHHEHFDGKGYPRGLAGEDIPLEGRITAVADVFDALSSKRSYKNAFPIEKCLEIMTEGRGSHFDPDVFDAFIDAFDEIQQVKDQWQDEHPETV